MLSLAVLFGPLVYKVGINDIDFTARLKGPSAPTRWAPTTSAATCWPACSTAGASRWRWAWPPC
jgi:hypothetical protein